MNRLEEYIKKYEEIHSGKSSFVTVVNGKIENIFLETPTIFGDGVECVKKVFPYIDAVTKVKRRAVTVLDYGCGQALQTYEPNYIGWQNIPSFQGHTVFSYFKGLIQQYYCYDPAVPKFSVKPEKGTLFDMVIMADVLEHVPEEHVTEVVSDAISYCKDDGLIMFTVSGNLAYSHFPAAPGVPGENAHVTRMSMDWWKEKIVECNPLNVAFVLMYTNNEIFKLTDGKINCWTFHSDSAKFKLPARHQLRKMDK